MKILYVSHRDITHPRSGGAEVYANIFLKYLAANGIEIDVVTSRFKKQKKYEIMDGTNYYRYKGNLGPHIALPFFALRRSYDIIISDLAHVIPWSSTIIRGKKRITIFYHLHRRTLYGQLSKSVAKLFILIEKGYPRIYGNSYFVTISSTSMRDLDSIGIDIGNAKIIHPGVDSELFKPSEKSKKLQLIYFSGLREYKRPYLAFTVLKELNKKYKDLTLIMVGNGPLYSNLVSLSKEMGLENNVIFTGKIDQMKLSKIISESHINIQFSIAEGFGIAAIESSACRTPTVAFRTTGVVDAISDGENGYIIENDNLPEYISKIKYIFDNYEIWPGKCTSFAKNFSIEKEGLQWLELIHKLSI